MVEYTFTTDNIFASLADPVRRDILARVHAAELTISQIALEYDMSLAAVSKHVRILQESGLVRKRRQGRYQLVRSEPEAVREAVDYFKQFEELVTSE